MKYAILGFMSLFVCSASFGASFDACTDFMPCGIYEGTGNWYDVNNTVTTPTPYSEKIEITKIDAANVNLKVWIYKGTIGTPWTDATVTFQENGHFVIKTATQDFGTGFCKNQVCTVAFRPVEVTRTGTPFMNAFVNTLRFEGPNLKRYNMVSNNSDDSKLQFQRSDLVKK